MNVVEIDSKYLIYDESYYYENIPNLEKSIKIENATLNYIELIHGKSCLLAYYIVYLIISKNTLEPIINTPRNGLAFSGKLNDIDLGIYHAHLEDNNVLMWYVIKNEYNELILKLKCIKHPQNYDSVLKEIMKDPNGYDTTRNQYFKDYMNRTYLKENKYVLMFKDFIQFKYFS